jgi:hydrogenase maturation protease
VKGILIAGIGNIFLGDDAFGCEVANELSTRDLPAHTRVIDFGIRSFDLAYALVEGYDAVILVDAVPRSGNSGTVYLIELEQGELGEIPAGPMDGHSLDPVGVLKLAETFGKRCERIYLVGCEPARLDSPEGKMGLSEAVRAAVPKAIDLIDSLARRILTEKQKIESGFVPS